MNTFNIKLKKIDKFIEYDELITGHIYINFLNILTNSSYYKKQNLLIKISQCFNFHLKNHNIEMDNKTLDDVDCFTSNCWKNKPK